MRACIVAQSCLTLCDPMTVACQAPLSMGFSRQEYWSGLPCPPPRDLPNPGMEPLPPCIAGGFFPAEPLGKPPTLPYIQLKPEYLPNTRITNGRNGKFLSPMQVCSIYVIPAGSSTNVYLNTFRSVQ